MVQDSSEANAIEWAALFKGITAPIDRLCYLSMMHDLEQTWREASFYLFSFLVLLIDSEL